MDGLARFDGFFQRDRLLIADVTRPILDDVAALRARHGFKTAVAHEATVFLRPTGSSSVSRTCVCD